MRDICAKIVGKNKVQNEEGQQRVENAPAHAQQGAFVFLLEVPLHQFFEEKLVLFQFMS